MAKTKSVLKTEPKLKVQLSEAQKQVPNNFYNYDVSFIVGLWGSGKTLSAIHTAIIARRKYGYDKIYITRPVVKNNLGILPGPQPLWSKVLTPKGWSTIGDINIGDCVIDHKGLSVKVVDKSRISCEDYYRVETTDGRVTHCGLNHLFFTQTINDKKHHMDKKYGHKYKGSVKSLKEIINTQYNKNGKLNHFLPINAAVEFDNISEKFIPPYVMGCLLGDGSLSDSISICKPEIELKQRCKELLELKGITLNYKDDEITSTITDDYFKGNKVSKIYIACKDGLEKEYKSRYDLEQDTGLTSNEIFCYSDSNKPIKDYIIKSKESDIKYTNRVKNELYKLNLLGKKANEKFIPREYIYNSSIEDRLELLRGLLDTDGTNDGTCAAFTTVSEKLCKDIIELVRSLGGRANYYTRDRREESKMYDNHNIISRQISYEVCINLLNYNPFYISRKADRYNPKSTHLPRISSIEKIGKTDIQCILLDSDDGLYITDDYIVTHNSMEDKLGPYMFPIIQNFEICQGKEVTEKELTDGKIEIIPVETAKGMTFVNSIVLVDEFEDFDYQDFITILTRTGQDSKMIFMGSKQQIDRSMKNYSCYPIVEKLKESGLVGWTELEGNFRNESIGPIIDYLENNK